MNTLTFERTYPFVFFLLTAALAWFYEFDFPTDGKKELLSASISVGAILAGFLGTAKAILMALPSDALTRLRMSRYMDDLVRYLSEALLGCLGVSLVSMIGFFVSATPHSFYPTLWLAIGVHALVSFWRVGRIMLLLLQSPP